MCSTGFSILSTWWWSQYLLILLGFTIYVLLMLAPCLVSLHEGNQLFQGHRVQEEVYVYSCREVSSELLSFLGCILEWKLYVAYHLPLFHTCSFMKVSMTLRKSSLCLWLSLKIISKKGPVPANAFRFLHRIQFYYLDLIALYLHPSSHWTKGSMRVWVYSSL